MALIQEYFKLTTEYQEKYGPETILLMQVGSFMEMYGPGTKIHEVSKICGLNVSYKNGESSSSGTLLAGFKENLVDRYLVKIQEAGYTAVLYTQHPDNPTDRSLFCIVSPGTFFYTEPLADQITNNIMCVWISTIYSRIQKKMICHVGVANVDIYTGTTEVFQYEIEYAANSPPVFDQLERIVSIHQPLETILVSNLTEAELTSILQYAGIHSKKVHLVEETTTQSLNCIKQVYQKEIFSKFYGEEYIDVLMNDIYQNNMASQTLCYLLNFIHQHNPSLLNKIKVPIFDNNFSNRLILANHSLKQLNIIDDGSFKGKHSSLVKMLNECCTPMGQRAFQSQLLSPITDPVQLNAKYDLIEHLNQTYLTEELMGMRHDMSRVCDITKCVRQLHMFNLTPKLLYSLHQSVLVIADIYERVKRDLKLCCPSQELPPLQVDLDTIRINIENYLDLDLCKDISTARGFDLNFFRRGMYLELDALIDKLEESKRKIEFFQSIFNEVFKHAEAKKGAKQAAKSASKNDYVKLEITEKSRPFLSCTKARFETLKSKLHVKNTQASTYVMEGRRGYSVQITRENVFPTGNKSNSVEIYHEELSRVCEEYFETNEEIRRMVGVLYTRYLAMLEGLSPSLEQIERFVTDLDVVCCKSLLARKYNYCRPRVCEDAPKAFVRARDLRHPIIELLQEKEEYVANDVDLGAGAPDGILLYGVNMAGKTSFIRAVGMSVIMAQAGLYVPAASFEYKPYNYIFTRIIGNDNLFKGLSTFAVEMVELKTILTMSNQDSLVLGDEVCSGTETVSACSIFVSALKQLTIKGASYVFATHLHEIVDFEEIVEMKSQTLAIKHMDVRYDATRGVLVYNRKLLEGSGSKMYGLEVCKSLHMPRGFLEEANAIRLKYFATIENDSLLDQRVSSYNSKKVVGLCEKCQLKRGTEVHHIAQQKDADEFGYVLKNGKRIHKNNLQNLMTVCDRCHREIHHGGGGGGGGSFEEPSAKHKKLK
jgi:DNA mismatch repair protein MutS